LRPDNADARPPQMRRRLGFYSSVSSLLPGKPNMAESQ